MLINLFQTVRSSGVPCTLRELLDLLGALEKQLAYSNIDDFYYLSRAILVKDEKHNGKKPLRSWQGPKYLKGFSDHLPIFMEISISK